MFVLSLYVTTQYTQLVVTPTVKEKTSHNEQPDVDTVHWKGNYGEAKLSADQQMTSKHAQNIPKRLLFQRRFSSFLKDSHTTDPTKTFEVARGQSTTDDLEHPAFDSTSRRTFGRARAGTRNKTWRVRDPFKESHAHAPSTTHVTCERPVCECYIHQDDMRNTTLLSGGRTTAASNESDVSKQ